MEKIKYAGGNMLGISFSLYGIEGIDYNATMDNFRQRAWKNRGKFNEILRSIGLEIDSIEQYSPKYYNYENDDLTIILDMLDKNKYIEYLKDNRNGIEAMLNKNKSYDGYIATTVKNVDEEIKNVRLDKDPDIICIAYALSNQDIYTQEDVYDDYEYIEVLKK
jgi:hypothetical protein